MEKKLVLVYLGILMMTFVMSAPPQQTENGFKIRTAFPDAVKQNEYFDVHAHVFQVTNGYPVIDNIGCYLHIYNVNGTHLFTGYDNTSNNFDYGWDIEPGNFSELGTHTYIIQCNGTIGVDDLGGFVSGQFQVTQSGNPIDEPRTNTNIFLIMLFAGFGFFMFMVAGKLPQANLRNDEGRLLHISHLKYLRFPMWGIGYFSFIATMFLAGSLGTSYLGNGIGGMLYFIAYLMMFAIIPMMYIFIAKIIEDVWYDKELRRNIKMGFEEDGFK